MMELLLISGRKKIIIPDAANHYTDLRIVNSLWGGICEWGGYVYQFGGFHSSAAHETTTLFRDSKVPNAWEPMLVIPVETPNRVVNARLVTLDDRIYIIGRHANKYITIEFNPITNSVVNEYLSDFEDPSAGWMSGFSETADKKIWFKVDSSKRVVRFDTVSKTFSYFDITQNLPWVDWNDCISYHDGKLYTFGGWNGSGYVVDVYRHDVLTGESDLWMQLPANRGTVNQGCITHNGIAYYVSWTTSNLLTLNAVNFKHKLLSDAYPIVGGYYRNAPTIGKAEDGIFYGAGSYTAVGQAGWPTANRRTDLYRIVIDSFNG